jgi:hypothetical protein
LDNREVDPRMAVIDGQDDARDPDVLEAWIGHLVAKESHELPLYELLHPRVPMSGTLVKNGI